VRLNRVLWIACALLVVTGMQPLSCAAANGEYAGVLQIPVPQGNQRPDPEAEARARMIKEMRKQANLKRQEDLKRDTDKLLQLANELKAYVDKTNENIMSVEVVKKTEEIEKLAHSVREKMKANSGIIE
jgi:hypothetical protein